ncbi:MAG TPA: PAS domain-containing sensor histidine kinase [Clostridia bacterium]|nr:PAS domain-containing sensor histidine kinase [Clostridia bacterium]
MDSETLNECIYATKQNEERFFALIKATSNIIYSMTPDWKTMTALCGRGFLVDTKEPSSNWLDKYIYPEDREPMFSLIQTSIMGKKIFEFEHRVLKADRSVGWVFSRAVPIFDENGDIKEWFGAVSDITERKKIEEELRESEERFRTVLENSMDGIGLFNIKTGKFDYINLANAKAAGFTLEGIKDPGIEEWSALAHPEDLPGVLQALETSKKDRVAEAEFRWRTRGGEYHWFNARLKSVSNAEGEPTHIVIISRDITKRKQAEQELEKSEKRACRLVKKLEEADKNKDKFISVLSHELRNPLAAILAGVQMLDITQDADLIAKSKEVIKRQTDKLCRLVDDLLELTRITQNKINLKKRNINLNEIIENTVEDITLNYQEKGVKIETEFQAEPIWLNADPLRIAQIIENILYNALTFTQENGTVHLTLKTEGDCAIINIKDNGIGICPEILPHLFTPFTQADDTLDRRNSGLGLGLSIVRGIVDLHGGTINAYSDGLGEGSKFTICLPITTC